MDNYYRVETPEIVPITYTIAGPASRCLASVIDSLIILMLQIALVMVIVIVSELTNAFAIPSGTTLLAVWSILAFVLLWGYYIAFELLWSGQTPGKRIVGLRVIREGGRPIDGSASAIRNLMRAIDFLPFGYGLGLLVMFIDRYARRLGDLAAGTLVVREGLPITLADLTRAAAPVPLPPRDPDAPPTPMLPNLHLLTPADLDVAEEFLRRRSQLSKESRARLAADLAAVLRTRLEMAPLTGDPERFIEHVVREYHVAYTAQEVG